MKNTSQFILGALTALSLVAAGQASAQAAVTKWKGLLSNQKLIHTVNVGSSDISVPGVNVSGGGVKTTTELHLCKDGSFLRTETTNVGASGVNVPGVNVGSAPVNTVNKASGKWKIVSADSVQVNIQLTPTKATDLMGNDRKLEVSFDGKNTMLNGERWNRMKSPICR